MKINGKEYSWGDVEVVMLGRPVLGITGIKYKSAQEKEHSYARGNKPHSIQKGNKTFDGSITLLQSEVEALLRAVGAGKSLEDIAPFDILVTYLPAEGVPIVTDSIKLAEFTECEKALAQGDKKMEVELPFLCLDIEYNI